MNRWKLLAVVSVCVGLGVAASTGWTKTKNKRSKEARQALAEIKQMAGGVPEFLKVLPDDVIAPTWQEMKELSFSETAIPGKYKDLIGLAVASQVPCDYCIYAHTRFAKAQGATRDQVAEAVLMASTTRRWSTFLNGMDIDLGKFRKECDRMLAHAKKAKPPKGTPPKIETAKQALADVKRTFGFVPSFIKAYPKQGLASAWKQYKAVELDPNGAIPPKYRELAGLAVAAQIPCRYCVIGHTKVAKMFGASDDEIAEAVAIASATRHWSTFLNGMQIDKKGYMRDVDAAVKHMSAGH